MQLDGVSIMALIAIVAFAIDRVVTGVLFLLSYLTTAVPDPMAVAQAESYGPAEKRYKGLYFAIAGILVLPVLAYYPKLLILKAIGIFPASAGTDVSPDPLDIVVTGIALVGGAERIAALLDKYGKNPQAAPRSEEPIKISGTVTLQGETNATSAGAPEKPR